MPSYLLVEKSLSERELFPEGPVPAEGLLANVSLWSPSPSGLIMASAVMVHREGYNHCNNYLGQPHEHSWRFKLGPWEQSQTKSTCSTGVPWLCAPISRWPSQEWSNPYPISMLESIQTLRVPKSLLTSSNLYFLLSRTGFYNLCHLCHQKSTLAAIIFHTVHHCNLFIWLERKG